MIIDIFSPLVAVLQLKVPITNGITHSYHDNYTINVNFLLAPNQIKPQISVLFTAGIKVSLPRQDYQHHSEYH